MPKPMLLSSQLNFKPLTSNSAATGRSELRCNKLPALKPCRQPPSTTATRLAGASYDLATNRQPQKAQSSTPQKQAIKRLRLPGSVLKCPRLSGETSAQASNSTGTGQLEAYRALIEQRTRRQTQAATRQAHCNTLKAAERGTLHSLCSWMQSKLWLTKLPTVKLRWLPGNRISVKFFLAKKATNQECHRLLSSWIPPSSMNY